MTALATQTTSTTPAASEPLADRLVRVERSIAEQQEEYAATRRRVDALLDAGDRGVFDALDHAADLAMNLGALFRYELGLLGSLAEHAAAAVQPAPDPARTAERLRRTSAAVVRRRQERQIVERRIEELRARDDPGLAAAIGEAADLDRDLRRLQTLEAALRLRTRQPRRCRP